MSSDLLNVTIIGAGVFGGYHINKAKENSLVGSVAIFDMDMARASRIAREKGLLVHPTLEAAYAASDAVIIATPAPDHGTRVLEALEAGCHCLVEKPLAHSLELAERITKLAKTKNLIVHVGHQERFVLSAIGIDKIGEKPKIMELYRENLANIRGTDVSVTLDLTVHDLDMAIWLMGEEPLGAMASGSSTVSDFIDDLKAELIFDKGKVRIITSRTATKQRREIKLSYVSGGEIIIDFTNRRLTNTTSHNVNMDWQSHPLAKDPLAASDGAFYSSIKGIDADLIGAEDGKHAVGWALEIERLIDL